MASDSPTIYGTDITTTESSGTPSASPEKNNIKRKSDIQAPEIPPRSPIVRSSSAGSQFKQRIGQNVYGNTEQGPELPPRTTRTSMLQPVMVPLPLREFVDKYSDSLPAQVKVTNGHYGLTTSGTLVPNEKFIISFIKNRKVLRVQTKTNESYYLPLGSAVQLSILYNPEGNLEKARNDGYMFQSVNDLVHKFPCPMVICATETVRGDTFRSTVHQGEILIIDRYDNQTERLQAISLSTPPLKKYLPLKVKGCFTTKPFLIRMYVADIVNNIYAGTSHSTHDAILHFDQHLSSITSSNQMIVKSLQDTVQLCGCTTARSLVCFEHIPTPDHTHKRQVFEIPLNSNLSRVEVTVTKIKMPRDAFSLPSPDDYLEPVYKHDEYLTSFNLQLFFYDYVRVGHQRDGVALCDGQHVYAEVLDTIESSPSLPNIGNHINDEGIPLPQDDGHTTSDVDSSSGLITKADLEGAFRSVLKDMLPDEKKFNSAPQTEPFQVASYPSIDSDPGVRVKLNSAVMELNEIENLWYFFGIHLGIHKSKLDQIYANHALGPNPAGRCLIEVICQWQDNTDSPTWTSIAQALYSMGKRQLAKEIASKHGVMPADLKQHLTSDNLKDFFPEDKLSTIDSLQQELQEKDQRLVDIVETLRKYEQKMENYSRELHGIKFQLQFNERFTRIYTTENEIVRKKQTYYDQHMLSGGSCSRETQNTGSQEQLRRRKDCEKQRASTESRLNTARQEANELKQQLFFIKSQTEDIKNNLHRLQDQKHQLEKGLHEQEQLLNQMVTGVADEDDSTENELPQYYNIIYCDGKVEVKLHKQELSMLQEDLKRKTTEVDSLKKELEQKHKQVTEVESSLAKQALDDEVKYLYAYADAAVNDTHERHQNEYTKTRLELELLECQIQLTKACYQKRNVESKLQSTDATLESSNSSQHKLYERIQKSQEASRSAKQTDKKDKVTNVDSLTKPQEHPRSGSKTHSQPTSTKPTPLASGKNGLSAKQGQTPCSIRSAEKSDGFRKRTHTNPSCSRLITPKSSSERQRHYSTSYAHKTTKKTDSLTLNKDI